MADISQNNVNGNNAPNNTPVMPSTTNTPVPASIPTAPVLPQPTENPEDLDTRWTRWRCMVCNYTYEGRNPLKKCPRCGNDNPDKFDDVD